MPREMRSASLPASLAVGVCAVVPELLGRVVGSLVPGLVVLGVLGWLTFAVVRPRLGHHFGVSPNAAALVVIALVVGVVARLGLHDRIVHIAFTGASARGVLPLQHPFFPGEALNYHVGFDAFAAGLVELGHLSPRTAVAVAEVIVVALMLVALKELLPQARFLWLLPLLAHGPLAVCTGAVPGGICGAFDAGFAAAQASVPPPISSLLQPPQGLGLALAFALLQLFGARERRGWLALGLGFACLAQVHLVVFLVAGCGIAGATVFEAVQQRDARVLWRLCGPAAAFVGWLALGSFSASTSNQLEPGGFFAEHALLGSVVFLPAALAALAVVAVGLKRHTALPLDVGLACAGASGLAVFLVCHYPKSWDIVKFCTVAAWFLSLVLARALSTTRRLVVVVASSLLSISAVVWMVTTALQPSPTKRLESAGEQFLANFGDAVPGRDCVATRATAISAAGVLTVGGPLSLGDDLVFDRERMARRLDAFDRFDRDGDLTALRAVGCRFVFRPTDAPHNEALLTIMRPLGTMRVGAAPWTLYVLNEASPPGAAHPEGQVHSP